MVTSVISFLAGVVTGWVARSIADTPQGVGVELLGVALTTKDRIVRWAALEKERFEDMMAEAKAKATPAQAAAPNTDNSPPSQPTDQKEMGAA